MVESEVVPSRDVITFSDAVLANSSSGVSVWLVIGCEAGSVVSSAAYDVLPITPKSFCIFIASGNILCRINSGEMSDVDNVTEKLPALRNRSNATNTAARAAADAAAATAAASLLTYLP